jgi:hypothetical protein
MNNLELFIVGVAVMLLCVALVAITHNGVD